PAADRRPRPGTRTPGPRPHVRSRRAPGPPRRRPSDGEGGDVEPSEFQGRRRRYHTEAEPLWAPDPRLAAAPPDCVPLLPTRARGRAPRRGTWNRGNFRAGSGASDGRPSRGGPPGPGPRPG